VLESVSTLIEGDWDAVWTVSQTDLTYHPQKQVKLLPNGMLEFYVASGSHIIARQELAPAFHRNGVCYAFTADFVRQSDSVFSAGRSTGVLTTGTHISIDTLADVQAVEHEIQSR